ncbi:MAG TPA: penicillin-binding transpeptidase domain-containing protein, partial [Methylomirabilota bacterium]|nr:penicillin-binding transpeptidase domain-containing protein [Methylomirabilota bacterium]
LQLISAVSAIANGGTLYKPHIVAEVRRGDTVVPREGLLATSEPRRVIQPETAATLRRLMEGVVLNGTGTRARLDGWTSAGKTGSAQKIDPNTGRYSPTQLIASFTGFAPINNPAVAILVSLDSPIGLHEGGMVAAPVFKRVAEQVLPYLEVSPDVPVNERLVQAAYKKQAQNEAENLEDFTPSDFSLLPEQPEALTSSAETHSTSNFNPSSHLTLAVTADEDTEISIPDFSGKTMRDVTEMCLRLGLDPVLVGTNLATEQTPAAGSQVRRGSRITVQFGTPAMKSTATVKPVKSAKPLRVAQPSKVAKKHVRHRH